MEKTSNSIYLVILILLFGNVCFSQTNQYEDYKRNRQIAFDDLYAVSEDLFSKNITSYPDIFFITSTKDDRVHPGHTRKMAMKLNDMG